MTLVVADTTPLNYLVLIGVQGILPALYGSILVPSQVIGELRHIETPDLVRTWATNLPAWVEVRYGDASRFPSLDEGEAAALSMAIEEHAQLLVDESEARSMADACGVEIIGTVGILAEAHLQSLLDFDTIITVLGATNFRVHPSIVRSARARILASQQENGGQSTKDGL